MEQGEFFSRWSELHGGAQVKGIVRWWLSLAFRISTSLARLRVSANGLTLIGLVLGGGLIAVVADSRAESGLWITIAIVILLLSLIADGVDGSLALVTSSTSRFGAALDAIADRVVESFWALAMIMIGADHLVVLLAWLVAQTQEYIRARMGGLGVLEVGVVTPAERPVRAAFLFVALLAAAFYSMSGVKELFGFERDSVLSLVALIWLLIQVFSLSMIVRFATKKLKA